MEDVPHLAEPPPAPSALSRLACGAGGARAAAEGTDAHWAPECLPAVPPHSSTLWADGAVARADYSSRYLTMRDGTRIAVDVLLPCGAGAGGGAPFNAVFVQSRYGRAWRLRWPYRRLWGGKPVDLVYFLFKARVPDAPQCAPVVPRVVSLTVHCFSRTVRVAGGGPRRGHHGHARLWRLFRHLAQARAPYSPLSVSSP